MKKLLLFLMLLIFANGISPVYADEIEEDYLDIAADYCIKGDYNSAIDYLDKLLVMQPDNKKVSDLKRGLSHIIAQDKKSYVSAVNPYVKQAQEYKRTGNEKMELNTLLDGAQSTNSYLAYYYLGNYYRNRMEYTKAIDAYNSAVSAKSDFAQCYLALAITLYDEGKYSSAINPVDKYLTFNQEDDLAYAVKSRIEFQLGMIEQAKADNDKALELNNCPEYKFDKAKILYKTGDFKGAKDLFTEVLPNIQT